MKKVKDKNSKPDSNMIKITQNQKPLFFTKVAKFFLSFYDTIELHAVGSAMSVCISTSSMIEQFGYAKIDKTDVQQINLKNEMGGREISQVKMIIRLSKSKDYAALIKKSNEIFEQNQASFKVVE